MRDTLTGIIQTDVKPIVFSATNNNYTYTFMNDVVYSVGEKNTPINIPVEDGFIYGKTHDNYDIAIYLGNKKYEIITTGIVNTAAYVKSTVNTYTENIKTFEALQFCGGTLNEIFDISGINTEYKDGKIIVTHNDDVIEYTFDTDFGKIVISINSTVQEHNGVKGHSINNNDVILTLSFESPQPIRSVFEHYNKMKDLLSFMTFRKNVGFNEVKLLNTQPEIHMLLKTAEVHIYNKYEPSSKSYFNNLTFSDLGDTLPRLLSLLYQQKDETYSILLGFIPDDDNDRNHMNDKKIKAICSALECELSFAKDIDMQKNDVINKLIDEVKNFVKTFRKENPGLSNDTYSLISSSIGNWSQPLSEKLCLLYHKYEQEINSLNETDFIISDVEIKAFVKYRNHITHGRNRTPDMAIGVTAFYLCGLIYCSILERIGISRDKIKEFCAEKILS